MPTLRGCGGACEPRVEIDEHGSGQVPGGVCVAAGPAIEVPAHVADDDVATV
jgi:hypothetical protein